MRPVLIRDGRPRNRAAGGGGSDISHTLNRTTGLFILLPDAGGLHGNLSTVRRLTVTEIKALAQVHTDDFMG